MDSLSPPQRRRGGAARFTYDRKKLEQKVIGNPACFLLQPLALRRRFREATDTLVAAIRRFDFALYSPLLSNLFGPEIVADEGSGVEALFSPKPAGRPKKPRLDAKLLDGKSIRISDILSEALDGKTKAIYVLCEQANDIKTAQWIPVSSLSPAAKEWWQNEREMRFPNIDLPTELPSLRLPVMLVMDDSS